MSSLLALSLVASSLVSVTASAQEPPSASPPMASAPVSDPAPAPAPEAQPSVAQSGAPLATEPLPASPVQEKAPSTWYGWQTIIADGATLLSTIALAEASTGEPAGNIVAMNGVAGYALAAPSIHLLHHRPLIALLDLAIRAGAPTLGAYIGAQASSCHQSSQLDPDDREVGLCGLSGGVLGATIGVFVASAIDAAVLARTPSEEVETEPGPKLARTFSIAPDLIVTKDQGAIGIRGTF